MARLVLLLSAWLGFCLPATAQPSAQVHSPQEVVDAFHAALASADRDAALEWLTEDVLVYEQGGIDADRTAYSGDHLTADMALAVAVRRDVLSSRAGQSPQQAWVFNEFRLQGEFRGKPIHSAGTETILLRMTDQGWRIYHIHWSQRSKH